MSLFWSHSMRRPRPAGRRVAAAATQVMVLLATACNGSGSDPVIQIRIATGSPAAVYYAFGQSLATILNRELPQVRASVVVTAASAENVTLVRSGEAELGFTQADVLPPATDPGAKLYGVARVYDDLLHLVTRADSPIHQLADLRGRRLSVGAPNSGTEITANRLLTVAGLTAGAVRTERLGLDASVAALQEKRIDAFVFSGGLPVTAIEKLATETKLRIVDLGAWTEPLRRAYGEVYVGRDIPHSVYGLDAVTTVADPNILIVGGALPDNIVHELTRLLMERRDELGLAHPAAGRMNPQSAIVTAPLPLHPGAASYYRTIKP